MPWSRRSAPDAVLVVGLGRFGSAVAEQLVDLGLEVLAVDRDADRVQHWADRLTHVVQADATQAEVLEQLGAEEFDRAVVGIGDLEGSILTATALVDLGLREVWAKALTAQHGRILERVGVHHVVLPEHEMGQRVAHQVTGRMLEFLVVEGRFALSEVRVPERLAGRSLRESRLRDETGVSVLAIGRPGGDFAVATSDTVPQAGELLVVAGRRQDVEEFSASYC